jgi:malate synthase
MPASKRPELRGPEDPAFDEILTPDALEFVSALQQEFGDRRLELLEARARRRARLADGGTLKFLDETAAVRDEDWMVAPAPEVLRQRWVEITGPTDRKMVINALNSGADRVHGRLRGRERADVAQHGARPAQSAGCG